MDKIPVDVRQWTKHPGMMTILCNYKYEYICQNHYNWSQNIVLSNKYEKWNS